MVANAVSRAVSPSLNRCIAAARLPVLCGRLRFGAKLPDGSVSHCFPLAGPGQYHVAGVPGMHEAYNNSLGFLKVRAGGGGCWMRRCLSICVVAVVVCWMLGVGCWMLGVG